MKVKPSIEYFSRAVCFILFLLAGVLQCAEEIIKHSDYDIFLQDSESCSIAGVKRVREVEITLPQDKCQRLSCCDDAPSENSIDMLDSDGLVRGRWKNVFVPELLGNPLKGIDGLNDKEKFANWLFPHNDIQGGGEHYVLEYMAHPDRVHLEAWECDFRHPRAVRVQSDFVYNRLLFCEGGVSIERAFPKVAARHTGAAVYDLKHIFWQFNGVSRDFFLKYSSNYIYITDAQKKRVISVELNQKREMICYVEGYGDKGHGYCWEEDASGMAFSADGEGFLVKRDDSAKSLYFCVVPGCLYALYDDQKYILLDDRGSNKAGADQRGAISQELLKKVMPVIDGFALCGSAFNQQGYWDIFYKVHGDRTVVGETSVVSQASLIVFRMFCDRPCMVHMACSTKCWDITTDGCGVVRFGWGETSKCGMSPLHGKQCFVSNVLALERTKDVRFAMCFSAAQPFGRTVEYQFMGKCTHFSRKRWVLMLGECAISQALLIAPRMALNVAYDVRRDGIVAQFYCQSALPLHSWRISTDELYDPELTRLNIYTKCSAFYETGTVSFDGETKLLDYSVDCVQDRRVSALGRDAHKLAYSALEPLWNTNGRVAFWELYEHSDNYECTEHVSGRLAIFLDGKTNVLHILYQYKLLESPWWDVKSWHGGAMMWRRSGEGMGLCFHGSSESIVTIPSLQSLGPVDLAFIRDGLGVVQKVRLVFDRAYRDVFVDVKPVVSAPFIALQWSDEHGRVLSLSKFSDF